MKDEELYFRNQWENSYGPSKVSNDLDINTNDKYVSFDSSDNDYNYQKALLDNCVENKTCWDLSSHMKSSK